jgi:DNA-binding response OmpR family regulator
MTPLERSQLEILQLKEKLEVLTDERDDLKRQLNGRRDEDEHSLIMASYGFTATEARLVQALYARDRPVTRDALMDSMYLDRDWGTEPGPKILDVFVCKVRRKMGDRDHIANQWGRGYELTERGRFALTARMEAIMARRAA